MRFELYQHWLTRQWRWRLVSNNNKIIATSSESYYNKADCLHGIYLVQGANLDTPIQDDSIS